MTYPPEPRSAVGQILLHPVDREALRLLLLGSPAVVDQGMIELERCGYCDSYAWSRPVPTPENQLIIQLQPGEILRLHKRQYPLLNQRIFC